MWRCALFGLLAAASTSAAGVLAGSVRILPWLFAPDVPWRVTLPFARALLTAALEVGTSVGIPLGFALSAATRVQKGEARALAALGVSPFRLALAALIPAVVVVVGGAFAVTQMDAGAAVPGRFANELVHQGRRACANGTGTNWIPVVNVTWICFPDDSPRIVAPVPKSGGRLWFAAKELRLDDDLTEVELRDFAVASRPVGSGIRAHILVNVARIRHLLPWGRPPVADSMTRRIGITAGIFALVVGVVWLVFRRSIASQLGAGCVAVAGGFALFRVVRGFDSINLHPFAYLSLAPMAIAAALAMEWLLSALAGRWGVLPWDWASGSRPRPG